MKPVFSFIPVSVSILEDHGLYKDAAFSEWIREKLRAKGIRTFVDLARPGREDAEPRYRYKRR